VYFFSVPDSFMGTGVFFSRSGIAILSFWPVSAGSVIGETVSNLGDRRDSDRSFCCLISLTPGWSFDGIILIALLAG
jgi:hypothetical protein